MGDDRPRDKRVSETVDDRLQTFGGVMVNGFEAEAKTSAARVLAASAILH
jgi:hypothetical protein